MAVSILGVVLVCLLSVLLWRSLRRILRGPDPARMLADLRKWYAGCRQLGDPDALLRTAVVASVALGDQALQKQVREMVLRGDWEHATVQRDFEPTGDYLNWQVVDRVEASSALIEVVSYFEPWADDEITFLRELSSSERQSLEAYVSEWTPLLAEIGK